MTTIALDALPEARMPAAGSALRMLVAGRTREVLAPAPAARLPETVPEVRMLDAELHSVSVGPRVCGFVQRAGRVFVALVGSRLDRAVEGGQFLAWDQAVAHLVERHASASD